MNSSKHQFATLVVSIVVAATVITVGFEGERAFEDFDLGKDTDSLYVEKDGFPIHFKSSTAVFEKQVVDRERSSLLPLILFFGNSQTSGVNQRKEGEQNYIGMCYDRYSTETNILSHTFPNANLQEQYVALLYWLDRIRIHAIVLPVFYDDLREDDVREIYFDYIAKHVQIPKKDDRLHKKLLQKLADFADEDSAKETTFSNQPSLQERTELLLNRWLESNSGIWRARPNVRGDFFVFLYQMRNTVLNISPQSKRKIIPSIAADNMAALDAILNVCFQSDIHVLMYVPPLRQDVQPPYDMESYREFKSDLVMIAARSPLVTLIDLDNVVPGEFWGMKGSTNLLGKPEYDFMHFQAAGHDRLFQALKLPLEQLIEDLKK